MIKLLRKLKNYWYLIPERPQDRNYFAFESADALREALQDPQVTFEVAGSPLPQTLVARHHRAVFPADAPIVIAWTRYHDDAAFLKAVKSYRGFLIVNDTLDQLYPIHHLYQLCRERGWVYIKHNHLPPRAALRYLVFRAFPFSALWYARFYAQPYVGLKMGTYNPHKNVIQAALQTDTRPEKERPLDILFIGSKYQGRWRKIQQYAAAAKRLGASFEFIEGGLTPQEYVERMSQAKICLSFVGWAPRCRREWEIPLAGALLLNDGALAWQTGGVLPLLQADQHFIWQAADIENQLAYWLHHEAERLRVARAGHELAHECFAKTPTVEWRLLQLFLHDPAYVWDGNVASIRQWEAAHGLNLPLG